MTNEKLAYCLGWRHGTEGEDQNEIVLYRRTLPQVLIEAGLGAMWLGTAVEGFQAAVREARRE